MVKVKDVYDFLSEYAPIERKMDFDNVGFLVGTSETEVKKIIVALDITDDVVKEAVDVRAQLIVSHHPLFFSLKAVNDTDRIGRKITTMLANGISGICMHTNLDAADGGVNDALADALGMNNRRLIEIEGIDNNGVEYSCGRVGYIDAECPMMEFLPFVKEKLDVSGLRYHDAGRTVSKIAVVGGSGGSYLHSAIKHGCDTLITADVKYDVFLEAKEYGINIIDADHFCTENTVVPVIKKVLSDKFPEIEVVISARHQQTAQFM